MLTVLIKHKNTGREVLYEAWNVEYVSRPEEGDDAGLLINFEPGVSTHIGVSQDESERRDAFVMNEAGKTVARYAL